VNGNFLNPIWFFKKKKKEDLIVILENSCPRKMLGKNKTESDGLRVFLFLF
jgi:hypothetical protein